MAVQINFGDILNQLKTGLLNLAETTVKNFVDQAKTDGQNLLTSIEAKLEGWTTQLASGDISASDFEWLVNSQKDLVVMNALEQAGLAEINVDQFKTSAFNLIINTVLSIVKV